MQINHIFRRKLQKLSTTRQWDAEVGLAPQEDLSRAAVSRDLPQLQALLKNLRMESDASVLWQCASEVNQELAEMAGDEKFRHVEPIFITAVRALHRRRSEQWAELPQSAKER